MTQYIDHLIAESRLSHGGLSPLVTSTASTLNGTLVLTSTSNYENFITGSASGFKVRLPNATTLANGWKFEIWNASSVPITLTYNDTTTVLPIPASSVLIATLQSNATTNGTWLIWRAFTGTASGILNYAISSAESFALSSGTADVLIGGTTPMSITPVPGTYAVWYHGSISITGNNTNVRTVLYMGGAIWADSLRTIRSSVSTFVTIHSTMGIVPVDGTQIIEARVARDSNNLTITGRSLILMRLGD